MKLWELVLTLASARRLEITDGRVASGVCSGGGPKGDFLTDGASESRKSQNLSLGD
jgi:hypothetical protein